MSSFAGLQTGGSSPCARGDGVSQGGDDTDVLGPEEVLSVQCAVCSVQCAVFSVQCTVSVQCVV